MTSVIYNKSRINQMVCRAVYTMIFMLSESVISGSTICPL